VRAESLPRRSDGGQHQIFGQAALDGLETGFQRHPGRIFRPDARDLHLSGQGIHAASLPIDIDDYIDISSFTHHPFYTQFIIEVPDNWMWGTVYNLPLDEMMAVVDNALENGYPVAWGTDVSEKGFSRTKAIGIVPAADLEGMGGTEAERWGKLTQKEKDNALYKFDKPGKELAITQEMRQEAFDNYETTDDHGMVIMGTATDQAGNRYYKVQNSWDVRPPYDGFWYFSRPFVAYKTTSVMVNKHALPKEIAKKLGIK
jgi:bleomycin hydrolase